MTAMPPASRRHDGQPEIHDQFLARYSPRAYSTEPVTDAEMAQLFEAARWAPSCFNEQPWLFVWANGGDDLDRMRDLLVPGNRSWAGEVPALVFVFAKRRFAQKDGPNRWAGFDAGAAWMSLALQAHHQGLYTHAMGGIDAAASYAALGVSEDDYEVMCAVAVGKLGDPSTLAEDLQAREGQSPRRPLAEVAVKGSLK